MVVVHGMGKRDTKSWTLLEWSEPVLGRADWLAKRTTDPITNSNDRLAASDAAGVLITKSSLENDETPQVTAEVTWYRDGPHGLEKAPSRSVAVLEARWSDSFVPMTNKEVFQWGVRFLWRAVGRMGSQFARSMVAAPSLSAYGKRVGRPPADRTESVLLVLRRVLSPLYLPVGAIAAALMWAFIITVGAVLTVLLPLLSPLLAIPAVKDVAQDAIDTLVDFVGDVATYRERPLRAMAMQTVVHARLAEARGLIHDGGEVVVVAHSQGAAIAVRTLFNDLGRAGLAKLNVSHLVTLGAAVVLIGRSRWRPERGARPATPVQDWRETAVGGDPHDVDSAPAVRWDNYWAIWDPFAAGPIADTAAQSSRRWAGAYAWGAGDAVRGPAEHAVHNTSSPLTDHQTYSSNVLQVIDPLARELLGPDFLDASEHARGLVQAARAREAVGDGRRVPKPETHDDDLRRFVDIRRARGAVALCATLIAVLLPFIPGWRELVAFVFDGAVDLCNAVLAWLGAGSIDDPWSFLFDSGDDPASFTFIGTIVSIALVAALLIWLNDAFSNWAERDVLWQHPATQSTQTPTSPIQKALDPRLWWLLVTFENAVFVAGAATAAYFVWVEPAGDAVTAALLTAAIAITAALVLLAPPFGRRPYMVAQNPAPDVPRAGMTHPGLR